jgi:hypothetical protein
LTWYTPIIAPLLTEVKSVSSIARAASFLSGMLASTQTLAGLSGWSLSHEPNSLRTSSSVIIMFRAPLLHLVRRVIWNRNIPAPGWWYHAEL